MPPSLASALAGAGSRGGSCGGSRYASSGGTGGLANPIHFQPPAVAVPRSTIVTDEKGKEVALHTVRVRTWVGGFNQGGRRPSGL